MLNIKQTSKDTKKPKKLRQFFLIGSVSALSVLAIGGIYFFSRYSTANEMTLPLKELSKSEYPENPADLGDHYREYVGRKLSIIKRDANHFDFVLEPTNQQTAKIVFKNIDMSLFVPKVPDWARQNENLQTIAVVDREWNRQQVSFKPGSNDIEVTGGDGFEKNKLFTAEISNNCLNAGLWEILLFTKEKGDKKLYYQSWFDFPIGHYKNIFENINKISYWKHWYRLEHWQNPEGTPVDLQDLRKVLSEKEVKTQFLGDEQFVRSGEQKRKFKLFFADNLHTWKELQNSTEPKFAAFVPPGRYDVTKPWGSKFWRIENFEKTILRTVKSPASDAVLQELELVFKDGHTGQENKYIVSGFDATKIPQLPVSDYSKGLYRPMGIGVPPFFQGYDDLRKAPPFKDPYFSVLLDSQNKWLNHHDTAIDGVVMHRDQTNPNLLHFYFLTYERHSLVGHYIIALN